MSAAVPCLRNPFSVLSCWMLSLVAALPLKIITKPLKRWNFPFLLNGDQGESYVATCKIISSASLLSVYMQCVEVGRYLCFLEEMSQFCQDRSVWGDASARAAGSGSQLLIWAPAENVPFGTIHETKIHCSKVIFFIFPIWNPFKLGEENSYEFQYWLISKSKASFLI